MRNTLLKTIALGLLLAASARAGTTFINFDTDPTGTGLYQDIGSGQWRGTGGNPATGGYLSVTDALNGQSATLIFKDFDTNLVVKAFSFSMDVRIGNGTARPADGFSVNYARAGDPVLDKADGSGFACSPTGECGLPEEGTTTGMAIGFDSWFSGGADVIGISVRVDNLIITNIAYPTLNGACNDLTSLQTGPMDGTGSPDVLCWQPFTVNVDADGTVDVTYKGQVVVTNFPTTYFPSAGRMVFAGRTGGANQNHHVDNMLIVTIPADKPIIGQANGHAGGFKVQIADSGTTANTNTISLTFDSAPVTPTSITKVGTTTTVSYQNTTTFLASGSVHAVGVSFQDSAGSPVSGNRAFTVPPYVLIPASYAIPAPATTPGMNVGVYQIDFTRGPGDVNSIANAEQQWARGFIDPGTSLPYPNVASPPTTNVNWVNWEQMAGDVGTTPPFADNFNSLEPAAAPIPNDPIPGIPIPGAGTIGPDGTDMIVAEVTTYLRLSRGAYRMGVNSDDGFKVAVAPGAPSPSGLVVGSFNGGRGAADSIFDFVVETAGDYPFRLLWWEGGGGANVEWFTVNLDTGEFVLVNHTNPNSVKAYRVGQGRAYVKSLLPANRYTGAQSTPTVKIELVDDLTTVVNGSISLSIDGSTVTSAINKVGTTTTVTWTPSTPFAFASTHSGTLIWTESTSPTPTSWTNNFSFTVRLLTASDLPTNSFWIEAEDFDGPGDTTAQATANVMPYAGGAYDTLGSRHDIDYHANDTGPFTGTNPDAWNYRTGIPAEPNGPGRYVPMDPQTTGGTLDVQRANNFEATANWKIGWADSGEWYNYTRTVPNGIYKAFVALSHGDPAGTRDSLRGSLSKVTAGLGTSNQTVVALGSFNAPSSGGWGNDNLVPMKAPDGSDAVFKVISSPTTLRFNTASGDFDWFALAPVTGITPKVTAAAPLKNAAVRRDATLNFTIEDFSTAVNLSTVKLFFDGADVTAGATITKPADITTVTYDPPGLMGIASAHTYSLVFSDNGTPVTTQTNSSSFTVHIYPTAGSFLVEAEDFNFGGGQHQVLADTMPYLGGAYTNLGAVLGVDYNDNDGLDSRPYRNQFVAGQNVNHDPNATAGTLDTDRGEWSVTANYKIGWTGTGNWYNYTRSFPANTYQVWVALSYNGLAAGQLHGRLEQVTSDPSQTNQTVAALGTFDAPGSGGWGANNLVQMKDGGGNAAVISLSGVQTVRFNTDSGDYDYLMFVPGVPPLGFNAPVASGGNVTISWTGTGTIFLQQATALTGNASLDWSDVPGNPTSPFPVTPGATAQKFYRLRQ
jgi:hypothetical protein